MDDLAELSEEFSTPPAETGMRWGLSEAEFARWWRAIVPDDQAEFTGVYGGDMILARFVCAFEALARERQQSSALIVEAYAIAADIPPTAHATQVRAAKAWRHDAVQGLLDRLRYRAVRQASQRITTATSNLVESMIRRVSNENAELAEQADVVRASTAYLKLLDAQEQLERAQRTKRGATAVEAARKLAGEGAPTEQPTEEQARLYLRMIQQQLGPEKFAALAAGE